MYDLKKCSKCGEFPVITIEDGMFKVSCHSDVCDNESPACKDFDEACSEWNESN